MDETQAKAAALLALPDAAWTALDEDNVVDLQERFAALFRGPDTAPPARDRRQALVLGGPRQVVRGEPLALLVGSRDDGHRAWAVRRNQNLWLLASELGTGQVRLDRPLMPEKRLETQIASASGNPPSGSAATRMLTEVRRIDTSGLTGEPLGPGPVAFTVLVADRVSNTVVTRVSQPGQATAPLAARRAFPRLNERSDALPPGVGLALRLPERAHAGQPLPVGVALRLPLDDISLAPDQANPAARLVLCTLLLLQLDASKPLRADLALPVQQGAGEATAAALLGFDLQQAVLGGVPAGRYWAYLVMGTRTAGPYALTVD